MFSTLLNLGILIMHRQRSQRRNWPIGVSSYFSSYIDSQLGKVTQHASNRQ